MWTTAARTAARRWPPVGRSPLVSPRRRPLPCRRTCAPAPLSHHPDSSGPAPASAGGLTPLPAPGSGGEDCRSRPARRSRRMAVLASRRRPHPGSTGPHSLPSIHGRRHRARRHPSHRKLTGGGREAVVVSRGEARAVFAADGLPALPEDKVYAWWYSAEAGDLRPACLLPGTVHQSSRAREGPSAGAVAVGITIEPAGGSRQPTTDPLAIPLTI
ncbi:anti-sigma factor [Streptomyces massasporeus]|uniref:anti-sigma factor n=1 Tax=Streptomyces massasporeus TaxID=67324 RepID=UPI00340D5797